jgi:hypothetical protein
MLIVHGLLVVEVVTNATVESSERQVFVTCTMAAYSQLSLPSTVPVTSNPTPSAISLSSPPLFNCGTEALTWKGTEWIRVGHASNKRRGVAQSPIWQWGSDCINIADPSHHSWRCGLCIKHFLISSKQSANSNTLRHLRTVHDVILENSSATKWSIEEVEECVEEEVVEGPRVKWLVPTVNIDTFRFHLICWIVLEG